MNPKASQFNTSARGILEVSLPISAGIFVQFIVAFIDNYFTAQIDGNAMSAVSFAGLLYITLIMLSTGLSNGAQIRIATHLGTGENARIHQTLGNALKLAIFLGFIQWGIYFFLLPMWVCSALDSKEVAEQMTTFMQYRSFGFLFYTPLLALQSLWSGIGKTRVLAWCSLLLALSTAGLDYLLIFGNEIIPALGVKGAAIATVVAEIIAFVFLLIYTHRNSFHHTGIASRFRLTERKESRPLLQLGIPIAMQQMLSLSIWVIFYGMIETMGEKELQSSFIVRNMYMLCYVSVGGFSTAAKTFVAGLIAEKREGSIYKLILKIGGLNFLCIAILSHPLWLYPHTVAGFFSKDAEVIEMTVQTMYIVLPPMWLFAFTSIGLSAVEGSGKATVGFIIELLTSVLYILAAWCMVYSWSWPIHMVWLSDYIYFAFLGLFSLAYLATGRWRNQELSY
jgi:putative MATE family efflux protein